MRRTVGAASFGLRIGMAKLAIPSESPVWVLMQDVSQRGPIDQRAIALKQGDRVLGSQPLR